MLQKYCVGGVMSWILMLSLNCLYGGMWPHLERGLLQMDFVKMTSYRGKVGH